MTTRLEVLLLVLAAAVSAAASPRAARAALPSGSADCEETIPLVINVGLPQTGELDVATLRRRVGILFDEIGRRYNPCPDRPLQVNVALGSDYQVLDWLGEGQVDVAVASSLTLHLLGRDSVELSEIELPERLRDRLLPARRVQLRSAEIRPTGPVERPDPEADFRRFREWLWAGLSAADGRLPPVAKLEDDPAQCEALEPEATLGAGPSYRLALSSHLATAGFLDPVAETSDWLDGRLTGVAADRRRSVEECFWHSFFDHVCFRFEGRRSHRGPGARSGPAAAAAPEPFDPCLDRDSGRLGATTVEIQVSGAQPGRGEPSGPAGGGGELAGLARDHLVILTSAAQQLFPGATLRRAEVRLPERLEHLFGSARAGGAPESVPGPFRPYLGAEPHFGVRPFAFTIDESLRLVRLDQRTSSSHTMALILPGGGVKAAYQSSLLDRLYAAGDLENYRALSDPPPARPPLAVDYVIGTSGGALLGFFVARLGPQGPWNLSDLLWHKDEPSLAPGPGGSTEKEVSITSSDVFGWTDLPRYASLLLILCVFGAVLAAVSVRRRGGFAPPPRAGAGEPLSMRPRVLAILAGVLVAAPLVVRWVNGEASQEHVPEVEGLFYAILIAMAMFADQCLVWRAEAQADVPGAVSPLRIHRGLMGVGLALVLGYTLLKPLPGLAGWMERPVSFRVAYTSLGLMATAVMVGIVLRQRVGAGRRRAWVGPVAAVAAFALASAVSLALFSSAPAGLLSWLDRAPLLLFGLLAVPAVIFTVRWAEDRPGLKSYLLAHGARIAGSRSARTATAVFGPLVVSLGLVDVCRPEAGAFSRLDLAAALAAPSRLDTPAGALFVCLGFVLLLAGAVLWLHEGRSPYRLQSVSSFVDAFLLVSVGLAIAVYAILLVASLVWPGRVSLFELTFDFWIDVVVVSLPLSLATVIWARLGRRRGGLSRRLHDAVAFLCERHPNAHVVSRRFVRVGALAVAGLAWWNFVLAPGLYGNHYADRYVREVDQRFNQAYAAIYPGGRSPYHLTAGLLAPANALETDGTRFLLVVPGGEPCPVIRQPPGSGSTWSRFRALDPGQPEGGKAGGCTDLDLGNQSDLDLLRAFVFASGSPFPIFPAHRVATSRGGRKEALVDGGYSNNTPVEAAGAVGAAQALIIDSSQPLPHAPSGGPSLLASLHGPLVANLLQLPGFLFERAQQVDRRSRKDLFVVSLAPVWRGDWPSLADFRRQTVARMRQAAEKDWPRRIGLVESWGPPRFQVSALVGGPPAEAASAAGE